jgi:hypothetical protein
VTTGNMRGGATVLAGTTRTRRLRLVLLLMISLSVFAAILAGGQLASAIGGRGGGYWISGGVALGSPICLLASRRLPVFVRAKMAWMDGLAFTGSFAVRWALDGSGWWCWALAGLAFAGLAVPGATLDKTVQSAVPSARIRSGEQAPLPDQKQWRLEGEAATVEAERIRAVHAWPWPVLHVKRYVGDAAVQFGVISASNVDDPATPTKIYPTAESAFGSASDLAAALASYTTVEELLNDGWMLD